MLELKELYASGQSESELYIASQEKRFSCLSEPEAVCVKDQPAHS